MSLTVGQFRLIQNPSTNSDADKFKVNRSRNIRETARFLGYALVIDASARIYKNFPCERMSLSALPRRSLSLLSNFTGGTYAFTLVIVTLCGFVW